MMGVLSDNRQLEIEAYKGRRCIFELEGKKINPYNMIEKMEYPECSSAIERIVPVMENMFPDIIQLIQEISVLTEVQKNFYIAIMKCRLDQIFVPAYKTITGKKEREPMHV